MSHNDRLRRVLVPVNRLLIKSLPGASAASRRLPAGVSSVVLLFNNQRGTRTAEFMEFDAHGKIIRVVANYSG